MTPIYDPICDLNIINLLKNKVKKLSSGSKISGFII